MKLNFTKALLMGAAMLMTTTACNNQRLTDGFVSNMELEGFEYDYIVELPDSLVGDTAMEGARYMRFSGDGVVPTHISGEVKESVRDSLLSMAGVEAFDRTGARPALEDGVKMTNLDAATTKACGQITRKLSVSLVTPRMVVWRSWAYTYLCGANHGFYSTRFLNYSISKGKILDMDDIFNPGYEEPLKDMIRERLAEDKVDLSVSPEEIEIPANFEVTAEGIRFLYSLYEIAPYYQGEISVMIYEYQLEELLKPGLDEMLFGMSAD